MRIARIPEFRDFGNPHFCQWAVGSGQWAVGSGQWAVGSGQWAVGSGQWAVGSYNIIGWNTFSFPLQVGIQLP
jgi:hypothetical protein